MRSAACAHSSIGALSGYTAYGGGYSMTIAEAIGIGFGFLAIVAPELWPRMPRPISYTIAGIGFLWLAYSGILALQDITAMKIQYGPLATIVFGGIVGGPGI